MKFFQTFKKKFSRKTIYPDFACYWDHQLMVKKRSTHCLQKNLEFKKYLLVYQHINYHLWILTGTYMVKTNKDPSNNKS